MFAWPFFYWHLVCKKVVPVCFIIAIPYAFHCNWRNNNNWCWLFSVSITAPYSSWNSFTSSNMIQKMNFFFLKHLPISTTHDKKENTITFDFNDKKRQNKIATKRSDSAATDSFCFFNVDIYVDVISMLSKKISALAVIAVAHIRSNTRRQLASL